MPPPPGALAAVSEDWQATSHAGEGWAPKEFYESLSGHGDKPPIDPLRRRRDEGGFPFRVVFSKTAPRLDCEVVAGQEGAHRR